VANVSISNVGISNVSIFNVFLKFKLTPFNFITIDASKGLYLVRRSYFHWWR